MKPKKKERFSYLKTLYQMVDGRLDAYEDFQEVGKAAGFDPDMTDEIVSYLTARKLALMRTFTYIGLTMNGLHEVEELVKNPNKPTDNFPAMNIINIQTMNNSQIQQATISSTQKQHNEQINVCTPLKDLISKIELSSIDEDQKMTAEICAESIITQSNQSIEDRNLPLVKKSWDQLSKIADLAAVGDLVFKISPILTAYFGINL